jgi:predicted acyltransferase
MRYTSIDDFRGFAVFLMFAANFIVLFTKDPPLLLDHARVGMFLPLDLVAPLFGFAIGLCLPLTLARAREGGKPVFPRVARRVALLFLIGYLPDFYYRFTAEAGFWQTAANTWGILETWALAYALAFLLCYVRLEFRLAFAVILALAYQLFLLEIPAVAGMVRSLVEGGPVAVLSWTVIIAAGTVYGEFLSRGPRERFLTRGFGLGLAFLAFGLWLHTGLAPLDRVMVSAAYTVFGAGVAALAFLLFEFRRPAWGVLFRQAGKYPLTAWILQVLVYGPVLHTVGSGYFDWPLAGMLALVSAAVVFVAASFAQRAGLRLKV